MMIARGCFRPPSRFLWAAMIVVFLHGGLDAASAQSESVSGKSKGYLFNDSHFHLTNYIQEGTHIQDFLSIMGTTTGRVALFGIPLQQQWSYRIDGDHAP